ncbi:MAG: DsrE family protein [Methanotrichaceae archaeon]|nr:DsrE family protein [Methanotrichaceae archaeon]
MKTVFYLQDSAPYGSEKVYGALNAAIVCIKMGVTLGLYEDGVYLALAGQNSKPLGVPNLADILYAYPDLNVLAHEPSLNARGLMMESLIETVELVDEIDFLNAMEASDFVVLL